MTVRGEQMSGERLSIWDDENVKQALADGRLPNDIACLNCALCGEISYYNQGSSFSCPHCESSFRVVSSEDATADYKSRHTLVLDTILTLEDVSAAEIEDYPYCRER
jgi:hypothetical protein